MEPPNVGGRQSQSGCKRKMASDRDGRCMMHKSLVTTILSLATVALFSITTAHATICKFTFQSDDAELTATGQFTVDAAEQVTMSGAISGLTNQTISGV